MATDTVKATWNGPFEAELPGHAEPLVPGESVVEIPREEAEASDNWKVGGRAQSRPQKTAEQKQAEVEQRKAARAAKRQADKEAKAAAELEAAQAEALAAELERVAAEERAAAGGVRS